MDTKSYTHANKSSKCSSANNSSPIVLTNDITVSDMSTNPFNIENSSSLSSSLQCNPSLISYERGPLEITSYSNGGATSPKFAEQHIDVINKIPFHTTTYQSPNLFNYSPNRKTKYHAFTRSFSPYTKSSIRTKTNLLGRTDDGTLYEERIGSGSNIFTKDANNYPLANKFSSITPTKGKTPIECDVSDLSKTPLTIKNLMTIPLLSNFNSRPHIISYEYGTASKGAGQNIDLVPWPSNKETFLTTTSQSPNLFNCTPNQNIKYQAFTRHFFPNDEPSFSRKTSLKERKDGALDEETIGSGPKFEGVNQVSSKCLPLGGVDNRKTSMFKDEDDYFTGQQKGQSMLKNSCLIKESQLMTKSIGSNTRFDKNCGSDIKTVSLTSIVNQANILVSGSGSDISHKHNIFSSLINSPPMPMSDESFYSHFLPIYKDILVCKDNSKELCLITNNRGDKNLRKKRKGKEPKILKMQEMTDPKSLDGEAFELNEKQNLYKPESSTTPMQPSVGNEFHMDPLDWFD